MTNDKFQMTNKFPMTNFKFGFWILAFLWILTFGFWISAEARGAPKELTGLDIIRRVDQAMSAEASRAEVLQTITTSAKKLRTFKIKIFTKGNNEKMLFRYVNPARVAGTSFLMLNNGDDIWTYFPKTGRVRHLATHMKKRRMMGSDFTYEDMGAGSRLEDDYQATLLGTGEAGLITPEAAYKLKLVPKKGGPSYSKVIMWVSKEKFIPVRTDYYEKRESKKKKEDRLLKRLWQSDVKKVGKRWIPHYYEMIDLQDQGKTVMKIIKVEYDIKLKDDLFTTRSLKKQ